MHLYVEVARRSFQRHLAYRAATLAGLFTNSVFGVLLASVYAALYRSRGDTASVGGYNLVDIFTFVWIGQSLIMVILLWGSWEIATSIQTGDIVTDLMKPIDYYAFWLSRDLGRAGCHVLTRFAPTLLLGALLYDLALPASLPRMLAFGASITLGVVVSFAFRFLLNVTAFWLTDIRGTRSLALATTNLLSGFLVPIAFFPPWLRTFAELLPFRAMVMVPIDVALGREGIAAALALQSGWAIALSVLARGLLRVAVRKLEVQGG